MNLFEELAAILSKLDSEHVDYALCGGLAMAVLCVSACNT